MTEDSDSFRLHLRFRKSEYGDLLVDLKQFVSPENEAGRVRYLLRLGLALDRAGITLNDINAMADGATASPAVKKARSAAPAPKAAKPGPDLDAFVARGFDITQFPGVSRA